MELATDTPRQFGWSHWPGPSLVGVFVTWLWLWLLTYTLVHAPRFELDPPIDVTLELAAPPAEPAPPPPPPKTKPPLAPPPPPAVPRLITQEPTPTPTEAALPAPPKEPPAEVRTVVVPPDVTPVDTAPVVIEAPAPPLNPVPLSRLTRAPTLVERIKPVDPVDAPMPLGGVRVVARIVLDAAGAVRDVEIIRSGGPAFDAAVITAVRRTPFTPGFIDDQPVATVYTQTYRFDPR